MSQTDELQAVRRMQEYIDRHLAEPITMHQLANAAGYSPWHSTRLFRNLLHKSAFEYIRALRLSKAALVLRDGAGNGEPLRVMDVALDFVFDSHEGFTRAFSRQFGVTPRAYRQRRPPIPLFLPFPAHGAPGKLVTRKGYKMETNAIFVQVIERPARKVMLLRGKQAEEYWAYCSEVGCDVWGLLTSVKEALYEPVGLWLPPSLIDPGTSRYVQGVELALDYDNEVPEGYDLIDLAPASMMIFQGEPYPEEEFPAAIEQVQKAIDRFDPTLHGFDWADDSAPRFQLQPEGYRGYIEARPVRAR